MRDLFSKKCANLNFLSILNLRLQNELLVYNDVYRHRGVNELSKNGYFMLFAL